MVSDVFGYIHINWDVFENSVFILSTLALSGGFQKLLAHIEMSENASITLLHMLTKIYRETRHRKVIILLAKYFTTC